MKLTKLILAAALLSPLVFVQPAEAGEYCHDKKMVRVGGWSDPFYMPRRDNIVIVTPQRPVYYTYGPVYRPVTYYPNSTFHFSFGNAERHHDNGKHHNSKHNNNNHHSGHGRH